MIDQGLSFLSVEEGDRSGTAAATALSTAAILLLFLALTHLGAMVRLRVV